MVLDWNSGLEIRNAFNGFDLLEIGAFETFNVWDVLDIVDEVFIFSTSRLFCFEEPVYTLHPDRKIMKASKNIQANALINTMKNLQNFQADIMSSLPTIK